MLVGDSSTKHNLALISVFLHFILPFHLHRIIIFIIVFFSIQIFIPWDPESGTLF